MINKNTIPEHWEVVRLGDFAKTEKGKKPKVVSKEQTTECPIPYINIKAFEKNIIEEYTNGVGCVVCEDNDFLMVWDGSRSGYVGKAIKGALGSTLVRIKLPNVNHDYAYYFLQSKFVEINTRAKGVGIPHVDPNLVWNYQFPLPPLSEQQEIVAKIEELLSELDKGKEQLETARQQLKVYRLAVLKWAFEGKLTNSEVKEGELPDGWRWVKIEDIASVGTGATPLKNNKAFYDNGQVAWVTSGALNNEFVKESTDFVTEKALKETNLKVYPKHTLLLAMYGEGKTRGKCSELLIEASTNQAIAAIYFEKHDVKVKPFLKYFLLKNYNDIRRMSSGGVQPNLNLAIVKKTLVPLPPFEEQNQIVQEIESRLSVCDKVEETIAQSLQQAETLRQSILKKAFEGKLLKEKVEVAKPKNLYFYQVQLLAYLIYYSNLKSIYHGEMTAAKYAYLLHKIFGINTYYDFKRWHLGPYAPEIKKAITNKQFFTIKSNRLAILDSEKLFKYVNPVQEQVEKAINELSQLFGGLPGKDRSHKTELLATVCKVIEDIQSTELQAIRASMAEWKIDLNTTHFKSKAEKFSEEETKECLKILLEKGWDKKLVTT